MFSDSKKKKKRKSPKDKEPSHKKINDVSIELIPPIKIEDVILDHFDKYVKTFKENYVTGRPSKFKPEYCIKVLKEFAKGKVLETIAIEMGYLPDRFYDWSKKYEQFHYALKVGRRLSKRWWIEQGRKNLGNKAFNNTLFMMNMTNLFDWTAVSYRGRIETKTIEDKTITVKMDNSKALEVLKILDAAGGIEKTMGVIEEQEDDITTYEVKDSKDGQKLELVEVENEENR